MYRISHYIRFCFRRMPYSEKKEFCFFQILFSSLHTSLMLSVKIQQYFHVVSDTFGLKPISKWTYTLPMSPPSFRGRGLGCGGEDALLTAAVRNHQWLNSTRRVTIFREIWDGSNCSVVQAMLGIYEPYLFCCSSNAWNLRTIILHRKHVHWLNICVPRMFFKQFSKTLSVRTPNCPARVRAYSLC